MFPKERPGHPSVARMSIALMLKMYMHHLLLGLSLCTHVICHYHSIPTTQKPYRASTDLPYKQAMYVCVCIYRHMHALLINRHIHEDT